MRGGTRKRVCLLVVLHVAENSQKIQREREGEARVLTS